jgi:hypothetical protein
MKSLDVNYSLFYVFNIPVSIINFNERNQFRNSKSYSIKYFRDVIKYFLEKNKHSLDSEKNVPAVSETEACGYIYDREEIKFKNSDSEENEPEYKDCKVPYKVLNTEDLGKKEPKASEKNKFVFKNKKAFIQTFRNWYGDIWNQDAYPEILEYLIVKNRCFKLSKAGINNG